MILHCSRSEESSSSISVNGQHMLKHMLSIQFEGNLDSRDKIDEGDVQESRYDDVRGQVEVRNRELTLLYGK